MKLGISWWSVRSESLKVFVFSSLLCALSILPTQNFPPLCLLLPPAMFPFLTLFCPSFLVFLSLSLIPLYHPERGDRDFNGLLSSLVQLLSAPEARTLLGFQSLVQREWVAAGHPFLTRLGGSGASEEVRMFGEGVIKKYRDEKMTY